MHFQNDLHVHSVQALAPVGASPLCNPYRNAFQVSLADSGNVPAPIAPNTNICSHQFYQHLTVSPTVSRRYLR